MNWYATLSVHFLSHTNSFKNYLKSFKKPTFLLTMIKNQNYLQNNEKI